MQNLTHYHDQIITEKTRHLKQIPQGGQYLLGLVYMCDDGVFYGGAIYKLEWIMRYAIF